MHVVSVFPINFSIRNRLKINDIVNWKTLSSTFYKKTHFMIISLIPSKATPTKDLPFSRNDHLYNFKKKLLILFSKNSVALVLCVLYMPTKFCIPKASFRPSKAAPTKTYTLSFA